MERLINIYALIWAMGYTYIVHPIQRWHKRHRRDTEYFYHMGILIGLMVSVMLILWGLAQ